MMVRWPCRLAAAGAAASLADVAAVAPLGGGWLVTPSAVWPALAWFGLANMAMMRPVAGGALLRRDMGCSLPVDGGLSLWTGVDFWGGTARRVGEHQLLFAD